jgi:hypothetical protein
MLPALQRLMESEQIHQNCIALRSKVASGPSACRKALSVIEEVASQAMSTRA